jgi:hypothetical protein
VQEGGNIMSFWKDPVFWVVVCTLGFLACVVYLTKGWGNGAHHAEPGRTPLERTTLLEDAPPSLQGSPDPFAHVDIGTVPDPDGSRYVEALRGDEVPVYAAAAKERLSEPPPVPPVPADPPGAAPVPFVPSLPVFSAPVPSAPLEALPPMARPVPPEGGEDGERERVYREQVAALRAVMPDAEPLPEPLPQAPVTREAGAQLPDVPLIAPAAGGALAGLLERTRVGLAASMWADALGAPPPQPEPEPPQAGDETREIFLGLARQMNWLTPAEQVALWDREFCTPITVGGGTRPANLAGASVAGLAEWDLRAPLSLPGGQRPAAEAPKGESA